jgi:hypothetical protein
MRCRECAVEVAARLGSAPGAGLRSLGSRVVVGTVVADMVVGAVSDTAVIDAAGKAVPAGVAGQAPAETYSRILLDLAMMLVLGGDCLADVNLLRCESGVFGGSSRIRRCRC